MSSHPGPWVPAMDGKQQLLIVEDEPSIRQPLQRYLEREGFLVHAVRNAAEARSAIADGAFDLAILDIMMPGEDGLSLARWIRASGSLPIIFLSARGEDIDRIVGLEMGGDDYLPKPFNPRELLARIRSILRRTEMRQSDASGATFRFGAYELDKARQSLTRGGEAIDLSAGEFRLLLALVERAGRTLSRDHLLNITRGRSQEAFDRSIDNSVMRLRRKLGPDGAAMITTVHGFGYLFCSPVEVQ